MADPSDSQSHSKPGRGDIRIGMEQNIGASPKRRSMEDASFAANLVTAGGARITLAVVADGIGGASSGERASNLAVESIADSVRASAGEDFPRILETAVRQANRAVYEEARQDDDKHDMGTTATAAIIHRDRLYVASVGDSRAYLVRCGAVIQLTSDHNWGEEMIRLGKLEEREAFRNPHAAALVRSIGAEPDVDVDLGLYWNARENERAAQSRQGVPLKPGDHVLLCSDGLIKMRPDGRGHFVETGEMAAILSRNPPLQSARTLVSKAMGRNANDNVSVIVLQKPAGLAGAGRALLRWGIILVLLAALAASGAAFLPPLLAQFQTTAPAPAADSILIGRITGEVLYMESGSAPVNLEAAGLFPVRPGGSLRSLEGTMQFTLPDSSRVYLDRFSKITLTQIAEPAAGRQNNLITLEEGRVLIVLSLKPGFSSSISAPESLRAQVLGSVLGAAYDAGESRLEVDCLEGSCLVANGSQVVQLNGGDFSWADPGSIGPVEGARYDLWAGLGGGDPAWITATPLPSPTFTATPTATPKVRPIRTTEAPPPSGPGPAPTSTPEVLPTEEPTAEPTIEAPTVEPPEPSITEPEPGG